MRYLLVACALGGCVEVLGASDPVLGGTPAEIQSIMGPTSDADHVFAGTAVSLRGVYVTGSSTSRSTLFVQEPDGSTTPGHTYPEFSATRVFLPGGSSSLPVTGDCIDVEGTVVSFAGALQVTATAVASVDPEGCGPPPQPLSIPSTVPPVSFADLQSRASATGGNAPGPKTAQFEDVLVSFRTVKVMTLPDPSNNDGFYFAPQSATTGPVVLVSNFLVPPPALQVGQRFQAITGVYPSVSGVRILNPRDTDDYTP